MNCSFSIIAIPDISLLFSIKSIFSLSFFFNDLMVLQVALVIRDSQKWPWNKKLMSGSPRPKLERDLTSFKMTIRVN